MTKRDRVFIDLKDKDIYDRFVKLGFFEGKTRKEQFLFCMALGFRNNAKKPLSKREGFFLLKDLNPKDEALIYSVAIQSNGSADILSDIDKVYQIAEEYACGGIKILSSKITQFGTFTKQLERDIYDVYRRSIKKI